MPKISVVLPIYNSEKFIYESVQSILAQTVDDFELILIDDASTDKTAKVLARLSDKRIKIIRHEENLGLVKSLNEGLQEAKGEFIVRMDHDDIALPNRIEKQLNFLKLNTKIGLVGSGYRLLDEDGIIELTYRPPMTPDEINWGMCFLCPIAHPTVMARREIMNEYGGYKETAQYAEDYELWERMTRKVDFANLNEPLLLLRKHSNNMTNLWREKNLSVATNVANRRINFLLEEEVDRQIVGCIYTLGKSNSDMAENAQNIIIKLLKAGVRKYPSAQRIIERDAAIRIALIGLRCNNKKLTLSSLYRASKITPFLSILLLTKLKRLVYRRGSEQLIG